MVIKLADVAVKVNNRYEYIVNQCEKYLSDSHPDFEVTVSDEEIKKERSLSEYPFEDGYFESLCAYRHIAENLPDYNALLIHAAAIEVEGWAYLFLAKSGTGKTTHIKLWRKLLGEKVNMINGDKPIVRFIDGVPYACGTAWCGKEKWERNVKVPIKALCFVSRGEVDEILKITSDKAVTKLLRQTYIPKDSLRAEKALTLLDRLLQTTKQYELYCTPNISAAEVSFNKMSK